jgi:Ser/Thr protein kinase RdoA (MazF antagonist)
LPDRGAQHYFDQLRLIRELIQGNLGDPSLKAQDLELLEAIILQFNLLESRWNRIDELCHRFPRTLVHGDLTKDHVRVRSSACGCNLVVFDWGKAGYGIPALDIAGASGRGDNRSRVETELVDYWSVVRESWSELDLTAIKALADLGAVLRLILGISWDGRNIGRGYWPIEGLHGYQAKLAVALERLGFTR